jgi:hypothetical protein
MSNTYRILVGKPEGKRPLGRQRPGGRIVSEWIWVREDRVYDWMVWLRIGAGRGFL